MLSTKKPHQQFKNIFIKKKITWYQNDLPIQSNEHTTFTNKEQKFSLSINNCNLNDSGEYKALLKNSFGEVECKCRLNIIANLDDENLSSPTKNWPVFVEILKDINSFVGQDICFKCKVTGMPQPDLKWFKDGLVIKENSNIKVGFNNKMKCLDWCDANGIKVKLFLVENLEFKMINFGLKNKYKKKI